MEGALIGRAIPKETDGHLASAIVLRSEPCSRCQWEAAAHNAISPEHPLVDVGDMHRAALATAGSCFTAQQLSHHLAQAHAFSDTVTMPAVMAGNVVIIGQVRADTHGNRFFTSIQVYETGDLPRGEFFASALLKFTDRCHLLVQMKQLGLIQCLPAHTTTLFGYHSCKPPNCRLETSRDIHETSVSLLTMQVTS